MIIFDASALVSAALKADSVPERALLRAEEVDVFALSAAVDGEIAGVLNRPRFARAIPLARRERVLEILRHAAVWFEPTARVTDCRDPKDNRYLELALAAALDLCTRSCICWLHSRVLVCPPAEEGSSHADERLGRVDLDFEWDEEKRIANIKERGIDFRDAALIFEGPVITKEDMRENYGEQRFRALGKVDDEYYVVAYTWRGSTRRIISAWRVDEEGKKRYEDILSR